MSVGAVPPLPDSGWASPPVPTPATRVGVTTARTRIAAASARDAGSDAGVAAESPWRRPIVHDLLEGLWSFLVISFGVSLGLLIVQDVSLDNGLIAALELVFALLVLDALINPVLRRLAAYGSVVLALVLGVVAQLVVIVVVLEVSGIAANENLGEILKVLLVTAVVMSLGRWLVGATDTSYVVGAAMIGTRRWWGGRRPTRPGQSPRGLLVVQLDGLSQEVVEHALLSGQAPNLDRWLRATHRLDSWWATIPSTTPASMAGFLHGDDEQVAAFRWWDRGEGRLLATSKPADSLLVEGRFAAGQGLLRDGGVAVSTTYTGGADAAYLTMSQATSTRGLGSGAGFVSFFSRPLLLLSTLLLTFGEMVKELYQGHRQRIRGVQPRIPRKGTYVVLRGVTNVLLRRLNLSIVAEQMAEGRPIIYVDFVDYDEIAHHAGPQRPEAMAAVEGLDAVLGHLRHVAGSVQTRYELVVVSDHGQSLGETFEQLNGLSLADRVSSLMHEGSVPTVEGTAGEEWGPVNALVSSVLTPRGGRVDRYVLGPDRHRPSPELPELAVTGGGNLGMVWFPGLPARPDLDQVAAAWPNLVPGLLSTPGIGLVMVLGPRGSPLVFGPSGVRDLAAGVVEGDDPMRHFPARTEADLARLSGLEHCGDLVLLSTVDEVGRIHAFEDQVGSHGGIGGPQNHGLLIHPRSWDLDPGLLGDVDGRAMLVGPVAVYHQLLAWRRGIGAGPSDGAEP